MINQRHNTVIRREKPLLAKLGTISVDELIHFSFLCWRYRAVIS